MTTELMDSDPDFTAFRASDPMYRGSWGRIEGAVITAIHLIKRAPPTVRYEDLPNEMGLRFTLDNGMEFIVSHGLHDDCEDFRVLKPNDILPDILPHLTEIDVSKL